MKRERMEKLIRLLREVLTDAEYPPVDLKSLRLNDINRRIDGWIERIRGIEGLSDEVLRRIGERGREIAGEMTNLKAAKQTSILLRTETILQFLAGLVEDFPEKSDKKGMDAASMIAFFIVFFCNPALLEAVGEGDEARTEMSDSARESDGEPIEEERRVVTVVIPASEKELVETLRSGAGITPEIADRLFLSKQWISYGEESAWQRECAGLFRRTATKVSDYDVYFVKIGLKRPDDRFAQGTSLIGISDAFRDLPDTADEIVVSGRLPKESYEGKGFYRA